MVNEMKKVNGVTLLEVLMVLIIVSMILAMFIGYIQQKTTESRRSRLATQIELILNAAQAYYVANNTWPTSLNQMSNAGYLPSSTIYNPWHNQFNITSQTPGMFYVYTDIGSFPQANTEAQLISGRLPLGFVYDGSSTPPSPCSTTSCTYVAGAVNVPPQNINNSTAVSFSSVYHSGACVPTPTCTVDQNGNTMVPQILVIPVAISGVNEDPSSIPNNDCGYNSSGYYNDYTKCKQINVHPISGYTANAYGPAYYNYGQIQSTLRQCKQPPSGQPPQNEECYASSSLSPVSPGYYWRVCLYVTTENGQVIPSGSKGFAQGQSMGNILAITRCAPKNEYVGSSFDVFQ